MIDSLGALLTAFLLLAVLGNYPEVFGVPSRTLTLLSGIAVVLCVYSASCYLFLRSNWAPFIKAICLANLSYCLVTMGLVFIANPKLTFFGKIYFLAEILVICGLTILEFSAAKMINKNTSE